MISSSKLKLIGTHMTATLSILNPAFSGKISRLSNVISKIVTSMIAERKSNHKFTGFLPRLPRNTVITRLTPRMSKRQYLYDYNYICMCVCINKHTPQQLIINHDHLLCPTKSAKSNLLYVSCFIAKYANISMN